MDQALHVAVTGERNVVQVVNTHASGNGQNTSNVGSNPLAVPPTRDSWFRRWRNHGIVIGISTVVAAVAGVATWLGWRPPWP